MPRNHVNDMFSSISFRLRIMVNPNVIDVDSSIQEIKRESDYQIRLNNTLCFYS